LGLTVGAIKPNDLNASARALHAALGMRRMLLIIDDAWEIESALVFRLGGPNCATVLTTRLASVALDFAGQGALRLQELEAPQGFSLLEQAAPQAVAADPEAARSLVDAVGGLPLALVLIGRHLRRLGQVTQARRLHETLDQLRQAETRLQLSQPQSPLEQHPDLPANIPCSLQTMIGLSEAALTTEVRHSLRALAYFPPKPNTFSEQAALAVSGGTLDILDNLVDSGLVECVPPDRYTLHQTISDYLRLHDPDEGASERYIAYFQKYLCDKTADYPALDVEFNNLLAAIDLAACNPSVEQVQLTLDLHPYLLNRGFYKLDLAKLSRAEEFARRFNDKTAMARIQVFQGLINIRLGNYDAARELLQSGIELAHTLDLPLLAADGLHGLGNVFYYTGEYELACQQLQQALELFRQGDSHGETRALNTLGLVAYEQGLFDEAKGYLEQALVTNRSLGNRELAGMTLSNLGLVLADLGEYSSAVSYHRQALEICRVSGNIRLEGNILDNLSFALTQLGQLSEAKGCYEQALRIFRQVSNQPGEATALAFLGGLLQMIGDPAAALQHSQRALNLANSLKEPYTQAIALTVSGQALTDLEHPQEAEAAYRQAASLFEENGQLHLVIEPQIGLAYLAWQVGNLPSAHDQAGPILSYLNEKIPNGTLDPFWIYLTCYKILHSAGDEHARSLLERAHSVLMNQAEKIEDTASRQTFLEKVPSHREVQMLFRTLQSDTAPSHFTRRRI
jgi:tetratricopeptide (TPR) repeat protein